MTIGLINGNEEFSVLIVPDDSTFITNRDIITNNGSIPPNSENVGFIIWSAGSRERDLI